jgi:hypothetical protein
VFSSGRQPQAQDVLYLLISSKNCLSVLLVILFAQLARAMNVPRSATASRLCAK